MNIDGCAGRDVIATQSIRCDTLADRHGDGGNVAEGFSAEIVEVGELVDIEGGEGGRVFALMSVGGEERWKVLFYLGAESGLDLGMLGEKVHGPGDAGSGGVVAGAEKGHDLVTHGFEAEFVTAGGGGEHVVSHDQRDDVFVLGVCVCMFGADDLGRFAEDDVSGGLHVAVHLRRKVFGQRDECGKAVEDTRTDVKGEDEAVSFADRGLGMFERVEVCAEASFANNVQGSSVQPFEDFKGFGGDLFALHGLKPEVGQEKSFSLKNWSQGFDGGNRKPWRECFSLTDVSISFGEEDAFTQNPDHP